MKSFSDKLRLSREEGQYLAGISIVKGDLKELIGQLNLLHDNEKHIYEQFEFDRRKSSYLLGRLSAKQAVMKLNQLQSPESMFIDSGVFKFPVLKSQSIHNLQLSISHCNDIGVSLAFQEAHPMGIDIEKIDSQRHHIISKQLTSRESLLLDSISMNNAKGSTILWSIKESLSKVIKTGIMIDFKCLEVSDISIVNGVMSSTFSNFGQYKSISFVIENYACAITLPLKTSINYIKILDLFSALFK